MIDVRRAASETRDARRANADRDRDFAGRGLFGELRLCVSQRPPPGGCAPLARCKSAIARSPSFSTHAFFSVAGPPFRFASRQCAHTSQLGVVV